MRSVFSTLLPLCFVVACGGSGLSIVPGPGPDPEPVHPPPPETKESYASPGGMWVPRQLADHADTLRRLGLELDPAVLSDPMQYPLGAVVSLGGCSASFVSPKGLIVTNHHCVTGALQYSSSAKEDLTKNGFLAKTLGDEKTNGPSARVYVTRAFTDVTQKVRDGLEQMADPVARHEAVEARQKTLLAECEKKPNVRCEIAENLGGGEFLLIEKLEIRDVRLVYAPHQGIGNFGGEVDNWRWPRHSGDFAFLRAYVGPDGNPADYSEKNVPYQPRMHLQLATRPLEAGDLVLVAGYPGRTYRLNTAQETAEAVEWFYPKRIRLFEEYLAVLEKLVKGDEDVRIKATPLIRGLDNALTYTRGSLEGLTQGGALATRKDRDQKLGEWIGADSARMTQYGDVMQQLDALFKERQATRDGDFAVWEILRLSTLTDAAMDILRMAEERPKPDAEREPDYQERNWKPLEQSMVSLSKRYARKLEAGLLGQALLRVSRMEESPTKQALLKAFLGRSPASPENIDKAVSKLLSSTQLEDEKVRVKLLTKATLAELKLSRDPLVKVALALRPLVAEMEKRDDSRAGKFLILRPKYVAALSEMTPGPVAPDANGTLRVTFGTVKGYSPKPGAPVYEPFTKVEQILDKATGKDPFDAPQGLLAHIRGKKFGKYADARLGTLPVDFLADLDITGGNSGSPTLNARGELVGLAFDGNYEAMASDWLFMSDITRSIHVDARYMLWVMDAVDGADRLLTEMSKTPEL